MNTYSELEIGKFYLVKEEEGDEIMLVQPLMETDKCVLLLGDDGEDEITFWKEKNEDLYEIVDELDDEQAAMYESIFEEDDELEIDEDDI